MAAESDAHRPRPPHPRSKQAPSRAGRGSAVDLAPDGRLRPAFPLAATLWSARAGVSAWVVLSLIVMATALFRWALGCWDYSGKGTPPMYGDFEAQRHWMESTTHLPIARWYFYDLDWWGLDYPPLTAYHSWILGTIGALIEPSWWTLDESRGREDAMLKTYMRATVLVSEYVTFVPAVVVLIRRLGRIHRVDGWDSSLALVAVLMQPATMLVDHGHFQYNTVMLGLAVASWSSFCAERWLWCAVFLVAAITFKQMALYYAPAVFASLLGVCLVPRLHLPRFLRIATMTLCSFAVVFAPLMAGAWSNGLVRDERGERLGPALPFRSSAWLDPCFQQLWQSVHRIFPFARGIFEDKVANLWCVANVFVKLRSYPTGLLQQGALAATLVAILPPGIILFLRPRSEALLYGMAATAWGFFLCSFQVHEKSVLLPLLPMTLLLAQRDGLAPVVRAWVGLANLLGVWTIYPLLKRDGLRTPYFVLALLWAYLLGLPPTSVSCYASRRWPSPAPDRPSGISRWLHLALYASMIVWHLLEAFIPPPTTKPDLWVVGNAALGAAGFVLCYLWCVFQALAKSGLLHLLSSWRISARPRPAAPSRPSSSTPKATRHRPG